MYPTKPPPTLRKRLLDEKRNMEKEGQEPGRLEGRKLFERSNKLTYAAILTIAAIAAIVTTVGNLSDQQIVLGPLPNAYALCFKKAFRIITVDKAYPHVQCLAVRDSHFIDVGSLEELSQRWNLTVQSSQTNSSTSHLENTLPLRYIDLPAIIVPGLSDSHVHVLEYGATQQLPLEGTRSPKETVQRVHDYILADPEVYNDKTKFIEGWGWDHTQWLLKEWPNTNEMEEDEVIRGRPVLLQSKDGHAIWVSRTILDGLKNLPAEIEGGVIVRDKSGNPTGVFLDNAQDLVKRPEPSYKTLEKRFAIAVRDAHARGLTAVHDAGFNPRSLEFFRKQADEGKLPIRIYGMTHFNETSSYWGDRVPKIIGAGNHRLSARSVKIFADGALRSGGAALYEPYADNPTTRGFMRTEPEVLNDIIPKFLRDGWQVNVHAIGDRANGVVLDAFEVALKDANVSSLRPRLEHAQILAKKDLARFGDLGVIASVQPTHAISDMWFGEDRLGPERVKGLYAFRSILAHGARITLGSDFPVEDMNPLAGFYAAITRLSPDGKSPHGPGGWFPEQRMTREEALQGMTLDPAYASFSEDILGSITIGKRADFVVFSQDIMNAPTQKILETKVLATVIDGQVVYGGI